MSQLTKVHEVLPTDCSRSFPNFMKSSSAVGTIAIFGSCRSPSSIVTDIDREARIFDFCTCCAEDLKNQQISREFSKEFANVAKFANFGNFQKIQLDNLVDF